MEQIIELIHGLGFVVKEEDKQNRRVRYDDGETFIDVWEGKKGITIGVYNPENSKIKYTKKCNICDIEKAICG